MICASTIIASIDHTLDSTVIFDVNEEEEKEVFKLVFEVKMFDDGDLPLDNGTENIDLYMFREYPKPHLNIIFPPPDYRLT